ncbi:MAG: histidine kinase [Rhodocyclaceae bacterium]|nr:histidine kinase [Rhodocyclaceae bacterium]
MSIPSRPPAFRLPDFRNQGIWLRLLLAANGLMLAVALAGNRALSRLPTEITELAALVEPALLLVLALLFLLGPWLQRQPPYRAFLFVVALATAATVLMDALLAALLGGAAGWRAPLTAGVGAALMLSWFSLRAQAQAPALAEARLAALNARIRPHFLFNSLNAILGVMREDPRRAEAALEELAELFRVLMRDNRELVPLSEEIALARKYLDIEKLRLGERLQVRWEMGDCPPETLAPPLLLQPLLENAVYHGIEPATVPGEIHIRISASRNGVRIEIDNPVTDAVERRSGNRMALENLRERLMLFYDLEARLDSGVKDGRYCVCVELPKRVAA